MTVTVKARSVLLAKQLPLEQSEITNRHFLELEHLTLIQEENTQLTFLKSNAIQIHCIPVAKMSFTGEERGQELKHLNTVSGKEGNKRKEKKKKGAAPQICSL